MNKDILQGQWKQIKGGIQEQWGKLTNDDLDQIQGNYEQFVGRLQERYGYSREEAEREIDTYMRTRI